MERIGNTLLLFLFYIKEIEHELTLLLRVSLDNCYTFANGAK